MKRGKQTCRILKEIRKQIAEANDIEFMTSECQYHGECLGTCPKCESEVRYLEQKLEHKRLAGKTIAILGISAGMIAMAPLASCTTRANQTVINDTITPVSEPLIMGDIEECDTITPVPEPPIKGYIQERSENDTLDMVEQMPIFPGGMAAMMKFISDNIQYPQQCKADDIQGRVIVKFVVNKDGSIINPKIIRGIDPRLDKEALRIVKKMPKWEPGVQNGENVMVRFVIPVMFRLQ